MFCRPPMEGWIISNRRGENANCNHILLLAWGSSDREK